MPSLQVREVSEAIYASLSETAKKNHRSLAQQTLYCIQQNLELEESPKERRQRILTQIQQNTLPNFDGLTDPVDLIREDRNR